MSWLLCVWPRQAIMRVHTEFLSAGADLIETASYQCSHQVCTLLHTVLLRCCSLCTPPHTTTAQRGGGE